MGICRIQLPRLISRWRQSGKGKDLVGVVKPGEIPDFCQDYRTHAVTDAEDAGNGRLILFHDDWMEVSILLISCVSTCIRQMVCFSSMALAGRMEPMESLAALRIRRAMSCP